MPRLPLIFYTVLAAITFLLGLRELDKFNGPGGKYENLFLALLLLAMVGSYVFGGLFLSDKWKTDEKDEKIDPTKTLLPPQQKSPPDQ